MSGRRQSSMPVSKRRRVRGRESGSSSNGESSNADRTQRQQQQQQPQQQTVSPATVTPLPVVNPASSRPAAVSVPAGRLMPDNNGDQVAPTSPKSSRRVTKASLHISEQTPESMDPTIHHQVMSLPKEAFKLSPTDFIWLALYINNFFIKYLHNHVLISNV